MCPWVFPIQWLVLWHNINHETQQTFIILVWGNIQPAHSRQADRQTGAARCNECSSHSTAGTSNYMMDIVVLLSCTKKFNTVQSLGTHIPWILISCSFYHSVIFILYSSFILNVVDATRLQDLYNLYANWLMVGYPRKGEGCVWQLAPGWCWHTE